MFKKCNQKNMYYTVAMYVDVAGEDAENPSGNCMLSDHGGAV